MNTFRGISSSIFLVLLLHTISCPVSTCLLTWQAWVQSQCPEKVPGLGVSLKSYRPPPLLDKVLDRPDASVHSQNDVDPHEPVLHVEEHLSLSPTEGIHCHVLRQFWPCSSRNLSEMKRDIFTTQQLHGIRIWNWNLDFDLWTFDFFYGLRMTQDYQLQGLSQ